MTVRRLTFGSLFDGVGCFSLGLVRAGLDLRWSVEIEKKCRRVTAKHFPGVPQYEDVKDVGKHNLERTDVVVGGSPCVGFSVAGKRGGMADERSGLFGEMARIVDEIAPKWIIWENVPGCFTTAGGEDFAAVLGAFSGYRPAVPNGGWLNSGFCIGPRRACAWAVLDCQHFGLAQRRKRVFVVCRAGDTAGLDLTQPSREAGRLRGLPWQVLLVGAGMSGDPAPRRQTGASVARGAAAGTGIASGDGTDGAILGGGRGRGHRLGADEAAGGQLIHGPTAVDGGAVDDRQQAAAITAHPGGRYDFDSENFVVGPEAMQCQGSNVGPMGTLRKGNGNVTGGVPFVCEPIAFHTTQDPISGDVAPAEGRGNSQGCATAGVAYNVVSMAMEGKNHAYETDVSGCLQQKGLCPTGNEAGTATTVPASEVIAFQERGREGGRSLETQEDLAYALLAPAGGGRRQERNILAPSMTVRRLTPTECERLQGLPDGWTLACGSDSARYAAIGNAGGVPVLTWIGLGILAAEHGWFADPDFLAIREAVCRSNDPLARASVCDWIEERLGYRPDWKAKV